MSIRPVVALPHGGPGGTTAARMAGPDPWRNQVLAEETPRVTVQGATFGQAPKIVTTRLHPDGILRAGVLPTPTRRTAGPGRSRPYLPSWLREGFIPLRVTRTVSRDA